MKKSKKTYAIYSLTEKHTVFYLGKAKVHVSFTGGNVTKKGVTPATFTTSDPVVQLAIEQSADFKKGAITLRNAYPLKGDVKVGRNTSSLKAEDPLNEEVPGAETKKLEFRVMSDEESSLCSAHDVPVVEATDLGAPGAEAPGLEQKTEEVPLTPQSEGDDESSLRSDHDEDAEEGELQEVEVSCKDVAKQYLQEHFGEAPSRLRTREDVQNCAAKYGIKFIFV